MGPERLVDMTLVLPPQYDSCHGPSHEAKNVENAKFPVLAGIENVFSAHQAEEGHEKVQVAVE